MEKFGNSLLLKFGITLADANPSLAKSTIDKAIAGGVLLLPAIVHCFLMKLQPLTLISYTKTLKQVVEMILLEQ